LEALRPLRFDVICENARKYFERERYGERELVCVVWLSILLHVTQRIYAFEFKSENRVRKRTASYCSECTVQCTADATSAARASRIIADMTNYDADDKKRD